ncbi:MAG: helix-turn-helix domain-containing protein [Bacteroidota bacterium]
MKFHKSYLEIAIHILFWLFYFSAINVEWTSNWFDPSLRPQTPFALSVLIFPCYFYANAFWLIPTYLNRRNWGYYLLFASLVFLLPEIVRIIFYSLQSPGVPLTKELFSRDSFLFGAPSPFFLGLNSSFIYRFAVDWFRNKAKIKELSSVTPNKKPIAPEERKALLSPQEIQTLSTKLEVQMQIEELYLNSSLTLRDLALALHTTEKKLSYLLNQVLHTNFYDYLNTFRVKKFKEELKKKENKSLSIVGLALNCGFPSKSGFYRAFNSQVGKSPSQYLKEQD